MSLQSFLTDRSSAQRRNTSDLKSLCRMCATPCEKSVLIYGHEGVENEIALKIQSYLPIKVSESDTLPLQLCYDCTNILIGWDAAVLGSIAAEKKLRAIQWQEQQLNLNLEKNQDSIQTTEQTKRRSVSNAEESLRCSVCSKGGMDFRKLIDHLKSHESDSDRPKEQSESESPENIPSNESECGSSPARRPRRAKKKRSKTTQHTEEDISFQPVVCMEPLKMALRPRRNLSDSKSGTFDMNSSPNKSGNNPKRRPKGINNRQNSDSEGMALPSYVEGGSGDPLVTSSTSTLPFPIEKTISSASLNQAPNHNSNENGRESNDSGQHASLESKNITFKPKVRIISAEHINHNLEQRAKANQSSRNLESLIPNEFPQRTASVLRTNLQEQPDSSRPPSKAKIVLSSSVIKEFKLNDSHPGPKYLRLPDGRIIRLLPSTRSQTHSNMKSTGSQSLSGPSVNPNSGSSLVKLNQDRLPQDQFNLQSKNSNVNASSAILGSSSPVVLSSKVQTVSKDSPLYPTMSTQPLLRKTDIPSGKDIANKGRTSGKTLVTFKLQPGPKIRTARYTCAICGDRNLLQHSLQTHAQLHSPNDIQLEINLSTSSIT